MSLGNFMSHFGPPAAEAVVSLGEMAPQGGGGLNQFLKTFSGLTESYWFYNHTIELRFEPQKHVYYLIGPLGQMTALDGVTTVCHIIDRSPALIPWAAKMVIQKLLSIIPSNQKGDVIVVPEMTLEDFTKIALEAKKAPDEILEEAGDIGHMAHTWLEYYIKAKIAGHMQEVESKLLNRPADPRAASCVGAALGWELRHNVRWIATERKIYSRKYQVAGTMDGLALVDSCDDPICCPVAFKDRLSLIDWKSSNYLYIEYLYQTAIYQEALMEEFSETHGDGELDDDGRRIFDAIAQYGAIGDRWVNRLGKEDGDFEPWHTTIEDFQEDLEGFLDCLSLVRSTKLTKERMKGQKATIRTAKKAANAAAKEEKKAAEKAAKEQAKQEKRAAREAAKAEERKARAQAKLDAKKAKHAKSYGGLQVKEMIIDEAKTLVTADLAAIEERVLALHGAEVGRIDCSNGLPAEVIVRTTITLPEEKLGG